MKHIIYALLCAMFCCFTFVSCDKDDETSEPEFKIQGDELMVSYDGTNWKSVGKLQGNSQTTNGSASALVDASFVKGKIFALFDDNWAKAYEFREDGFLYEYRYEDEYAHIDTSKYINAGNTIFAGDGLDLFVLYTDSKTYYLTANDDDVYTNEGLTKEGLSKVINTFGIENLFFYEEINKSALDKIIKKIDEIQAKQK